MRIASIGTLMCLVISAPAQQVWLPSSGGNGHTYEVRVVQGGISWLAASTDAIARNGHLVTITSAAESAFVLSLVNTPTCWVPNPYGYSFGPWIGAYQLPGSVEPNGGWVWVTGEPMVYTNWLPGQPNNSCAPGEDHAHFMENTYPARGNSWNDLAPASCGMPSAYVVEWDVSLVVDQPQGPGTPIIVTNHDLNLGSEYFNVFSTDVCAGTGAGPYLGLCASGGAGLQLIALQVLAPLSTPPFHVLATSPSASWPAVPNVPPITIQGVCFEVVGGSIGETSRVVTFTVF